MSLTELKAKPGSYVWDEATIKFVGRINKDGTEDKRFTKTGFCSLLNTVIKETGYVPKDPQVFAKAFAEHKKSLYLVKGFGLVVDCITLDVDHWIAKAAELLGQECDGIADILKQISHLPEVERKAKAETLALIFSKELKRAKLSDLVTEEDAKLTELRSIRAKGLTPEAYWKQVEERKQFELDLQRQKQNAERFLANLNLKLRDLELLERVIDAVRSNGSLHSNKTILKALMSTAFLDELMESQDQGKPYIVKRIKRDFYAFVKLYGLGTLNFKFGYLDPLLRIHKSQAFPWNEPVLPSSI